MTRQQASILWPAVKAWGEGESIQHRYVDGGWMDSECPNFSANGVEWRVKPKGGREVWVCYHDSQGLPVAVLDKPFTPPAGYTLVHCIEVTTP